MFWGRLAAWIAGVPTIASALHSTGWPDGVSRLNRLLTPITDAFIAVADGHAEHLKSNERFPQQRVFTVRNGIDTDRFKADPVAFESIRKGLGIEDTSPVFGIVAALREEKNHAMFLRVARGVVDICSQARFMIVGDGPERQRIEAMIHDLELTSNVFMLGTRHDTPALLAAMDGFLLCSRNEASPVSILEALACEVPVIATNVGSVAESVIPNLTGYLVAVDEDQAMLQHVIDIISDGELRAYLGQRGRQVVIQSGSLNSMVNGYTELIEKLYDATTVKRHSNEVLVDRRRISREQIAPANRST
jgi:glycosyltransferase involved in cell wall biosynthesis